MLHALDTLSQFMEVIARMVELQIKWQVRRSLSRHYENYCFGLCISRCDGQFEGTDEDYGMNTLQHPQGSDVDVQ